MAKVCYPLMAREERNILYCHLLRSPLHAPALIVPDQIRQCLLFPLFHPLGKFRSEKPFRRPILRHVFFKQARFSL